MRVFITTKIIKHKSNQIILFINPPYFHRSNFRNNFSKSITQILFWIAPKSNPKTFFSSKRIYGIAYRENHVGKHGEN